MTTYTMTTFHFEPFAETCTHCKKGINHGEFANDINGEFYHERCWNWIVRDYAEANIIEPEEGDDHCESCGHDLHIEGIKTVLDGDKVKCFDCVVREGQEDGRIPL